MTVVRTFVVILASLLPGCVSWDAPDTDGDGFLTSDGDCDDLNPNISPAAAEIWYDGIDQDCDGNDDDQDLDGLKSEAVGGPDCWDDPTEIPLEFTVVAGQGFSQPSAAEVNPGATEVWYDDVDQNCDGASDFDQDGDGYDASAWADRDGNVGDDCVDNDEELATLQASASWSYAGDVTAAEINPGRDAADDTCYDGLNLDCNVSEPADGNDFPDDYETDFDCDLDGFHQDTDCDDSDDAVFPDPSVEEVWYNGVDENCDNNDADQDLDGFDSWVVGGDDCWDDPSEIRTDFDALNGFSQPDADAVNPDATEVWYDGIDQDCAEDDDFDADLDTQTTDAYADRDGVTGTDCDDADPSSFLYATEYCDDVDHDCDGLIETDDDAFDATQYYFDADDDGYGTSTAKTYCQPVDEFRADNPDDCDDNDPAEYPGADEYCDGDDDDCDGDIDEDGSVDVETWYRDFDGDGYGNASNTDIDCYEPTGYLADDQDCDDTDDQEYPGADEYCDGDDDDCDDEIDEDDSVDVATWYEDSDGDGYGNLNSTDIDCYEPTGYLADDQDCDDTDANEYPGADEYCDGDDDDCDNQVDEDESVDVITWYRDADTDTYGNASITQIDCDQPTGFVEDDQDCDDSDIAINPAATEVCDLDDNDCDDLVDDDDPSVDYTSITLYYPDGDGDGYGDETDGGTPWCAQPSGTVTDNTDCDDGEGAINPSAQEVCDSGVDNDCDGLADDDSGSGVDYTGETTYYVDDDGDGFGDETDGGTPYCESYSGFSELNSDCDDGESAVNPDATEVCDDIDNDCDDDIDDDDSSTDYTGEVTYYVDVDGDTYGDSSDPGTPYCDQPASTSTSADDCNDTIAEINIAATETCDGADNDCDTNTDEGFDSDGDGTPDCQDGEDCDGVDNDGDTNVDEGYDSDTDGIADCFDTEECDGVDNDGDGLVDDLDPDVDLGTATLWIDDLDGDGFGDDTDPGTLQCDPPAANDHVTDNTDCDDGAAAVNTDATEVCDDIDNDCDDDIDDDDTSIDYTGETTYYSDIDGDSYGDETDAGAPACDQPASTSTNAQDCDDGLDTINPAATEVCDGVDNDCDDDIDDADANVDLTGETVYYPDSDGDGEGNDSIVGTQYCTPISGVVANNDDCDDGEITINTSATEVCDTVDNDCDGLTDDDDTSTDYTGETTYYDDLDGDGDGDANDVGEPACTQPSDTSENADDCDDGDFDINLAATEICDAADVDEDCDTLTDDDDPSVDLGTGTTFYTDADNDTYGDENDLTGTAFCDQPALYSLSADDCDDSETTINPGASEVCDGGVDNDCNGDADDADAGTDVSTKTTYYVDADSDGYGSSTIPGSDYCDQPSLTSLTSDDCEDGDGAINPGATEVCDGDVDNDCSGAADDADTNTTEASKTTWFTDGDGDGYGDENDAGTDLCTQPSNTSTSSDDCDDVDGAINPGATEVCDSDVDNDCNGSADDADTGTDAGTKTLYYPDTDSDGYGDEDDLGTLYCSGPTGTVTDNTDCDDGVNGYNPAVSWYIDGDLDGFGGALSQVCEPVNGTDVDNGDDCDDANDAYYPGVTWYVDGDGDTYGDDFDTQDCEPQFKTDVLVGGDCNDVVDTYYPGVTWYDDGDSDTYGDATTGVDCQPDDASDVEDATDCDDTLTLVNPGGTETDDSDDEDCDDAVDEDFATAGDLIITEIMITPAGSEPANEWLELYNGHATDDFYADGVLISNGTESFYLGVGGVVVPSMGYAVLCSDVTTLGTSCDYVYGSDTNGSSAQGATFEVGELLTDGTATLSLVLGGVTLDDITYQDGTASWPGQTTGYSVVLDSGSYSEGGNDSGNSWCYPATASDQYDAVNGNYGSPGTLGGCENSAPN